MEKAVTVAGAMAVAIAMAMAGAGAMAVVAGIQILQVKNEQGDGGRIRRL